MCRNIIFCRILFIATIYFFPGWILAQSIGNYSVLRSTGISYNSIIGTGNSFSSWRNADTFSVDDNRSEATDIGFDFWYNGQRYTQFSVSTNGFLDFSNSTDNGGAQCDDYGYCNTNFTSSNVSTGTWLALAPFYDDMTTRDGVDPLGTSIKYKLSGAAPNRVLTVEWDAMAVYQNTTPDINFQVKLYETTGEIEFVYETMDNGNTSFSYTVGMNAASISNPPTSSELLTQQTVNTSNFSNSPQNNLSTMPEANSLLQFVPPVPSNPVGSLTFTNKTNSGMTLNWSDWANNEVGYAIYYSTDGSNYFYTTQTSANTTSVAVANLIPSTTYYWKIFAVTEGALSNPLTGSTATLAPSNITSITSGRWDVANTWDCNCIPSAGDNVTIQDSHTVRIRASNLVCNDLTIGQGTSGRLRYIRNNSRDLTVNGNVIINTGATLEVRTNSNTTHTLNIRGNITNDGTLNLQADGNSLCNVNFIKTDGNQLVSGTGTTIFYAFYLDNSLKSNTVEITANNFTCDPDALNFSSGGTFKFSSAGANNFTLASGNLEIPSQGKVWMNSANSTMNFGGNLTLNGDLMLDAGILNIGDAADENVISNGGQLELNGGTMNIAGRYEQFTSESISNYTQTGGALIVPTIGSTSNANAPFGLNVTGSTLNLSGGEIVIQQAGGTNLGYNTSGVSSYSITDGTIQIGNGSTPNGQVIQINTNSPIGNLLVNSANATAQLAGNLNILNNATITSGSLDANDFDIALNGDWLANGGSFTPSSIGTVTFNGGDQSITSGGSAFNHLILSGSGTKSVQDNLTVNGDLTFSVILSPIQSDFVLTLGGNWTNNGSFVRNNETLTLNGVSDQTISGTTATDITNITVSKSGGSVLIESAVNLYQTLDIQSATTFDADGSGSGVFSMISNATEESRIASLPVGASVTGNIRAEKYIPPYGSKRWRNIGFPVNGASVADIQNEIPISGNFTGTDNGTGSIPNYAKGSLAYYDNTIGDNSQTMDDRWVLYPTTDNTVLLTTNSTEGRGYSIWIRELGAVTFDITGTVNQGSIDFQPTGSFERWNLMGNPYPSAIDWDAAGWTKAGIQGNAIYVWDGLQYRTWNGSVGDMGDGLIAKGQAFWVQGSQDNMTLIASEDVKSANKGTTYRITDDASYLELVVTDNTYTDKAYVYFKEDALPEYDEQDASKLLNYIFSLSSLSADSVKLAINAIGIDICKQEIPLAIEYIWEGTYSMGWNNLSSLPEYLQLTLHDKFTNESYDLRAVDSFDFTITADAGSYEKYRFYLSISSQPVNSELVTGINQECGTNGAAISIENSQPDILYTVYKNDTDFILSAYGTGEKLVVPLDSSYLDLGLNEFTIEGIAGSCSQATLNPAKLMVVEQPVIMFDEETNSISVHFQPNLEWFKNGVPIEAQGDTLIVIDDQPAEYYAQVTNGKCTLLSDPYIVTTPKAEEVVTSRTTDEEFAKNGIHVYPNPFSDYLVIDLKRNAINPDQFEIIDVTGKKIKSASIESSLIEINTSHLDPGIYYLKLSHGDQLRSFRIVKD